jgi:polyisoprenoid-binding protein YceI
MMSVFTIDRTQTDKEALVMSQLFRNRGVVVQFISVLVLAATFGVLIASSAMAQEATPAAGVIGTPEATSECPAPDATPEAAPEGATVFAIDSENSEARWKAQQELVGIGANEAVGKTNAFVGNIAFGEDGLPLACSRFDVDLRTIDSGEPLRDNTLQTQTLQTDQFPLATFILTDVEGLDQPPADGEEAAARLIGALSFHDVTKLVAWDATFTIDGDTLTGSATTNFKMSDYNIEPPTVGPVLSIDETVALEIDVTAQKAS